MEDIRQLLSTYLADTPGLLGIVLSDRDGIPIVRSTLPDCPDSVTKPGFLSAHSSTSEQAGKVGLGENQTIMAVYNNYQVVHVIHSGVVITLVASSAAVLNDVRQVADNMKPLVTDIGGAVLD